MLSRLLFLLVLIMTSSSFVALGADKVTGKITVDDNIVPVRHVYALLHDNAEGILQSPTQLRILVTDREVPLELLYGLIFLPVEDLARRGEVQGILLQFDPAKKGGDVDMTVLMPRALRKDTNRISIKDFELGLDQVKGSFEFAEDSFLSFPEYPKAKFNFRVSAIVQRPPSVTADLKGKDALNSPQVKAVLAITNALAMGDFKTIHKLSSVKAARINKEEMARRGPGTRKFYIKTGTDLKKSIRGAKRVVVRGNSAVVILPENGMFDLVFEGGRWKGN